MSPGSSLVLSPHFSVFLALFPGKPLKTQGTKFGMFFSFVKFAQRSRKDMWEKYNLYIFKHPIDKPAALAYNSLVDKKC